MPEEAKMAPPLRFQGFSDAWEQRKFEEMLDKNDGVRRGPFGSSLKKEIFVENSDYVVYEQQNAIYDNYKTRYNISKEKFDELHKFSLKENDFIMSGAGTIGRISRVPKGIKPGVFNQALIRFRINSELTDPKYFLQFIRAENMQRKLTGANPGSAITNLVPMTEVKNWEIFVPAKAEQIKIGDFFKNLDNTIALHQRKLTLLKQLKQTYLQALFPQSELNIPTLRFARFSDSWEQRKVSSLAKETFGGGTPKTGVKKYWKGSFPWIQSSDLTTNQLHNVQPTKFITEEAIKQSATHNVPGNSIAIVTRVGVGKLALMRSSYSTSQDFLSLSNLNVDAVFGVYCLYKMLQREVNNIQGTSIKGITKADLLEKCVSVPTKVEEQVKIGAFFKKIDDTIDFHESKLKHILELKKAFLEKMFL